MRIGQGYDVHRLVEGRDLILGGVTVPYEKGLLGHSDADVLVHAVMDALLGAAALGDIGQHFPDTDPAYKGISSIKLLEAVGKLLEEKGYVIENIDATIIAQRPKLAVYRPQMAENIAHALKLPVNRVSVKATTDSFIIPDTKNFSSRFFAKEKRCRNLLTPQYLSIFSLKNSAHKGFFVQ